MWTWSQAIYNQAWLHRNIIATMKSWYLPIQPVKQGTGERLPWTDGRARKTRWTLLPVWCFKKPHQVRPEGKQLRDILWCRMEYDCGCRCQREPYFDQVWILGFFLRICTLSNFVRISLCLGFARGSSYMLWTSSGHLIVGLTDEKAIVYCMTL